MLAEKQDFDLDLNHSMSSVARHIHNLRWLNSPAIISDPRWNASIMQIYMLDKDPEKEKERVRIFVDWVWGCIKLIQPYADSIGAGKEWEAMTTQRTRESNKVVRRMVSRTPLKGIANSINNLIGRNNVDHSQDPGEHHNQLIGEWLEIDKTLGLSPYSPASSLASVADQALYCMMATFPGRQFWREDTPVDMLERFLGVG
jgi:hypothetical protein